MDWSKAKKILIVAFLIVNIVLLITILQKTKGQDQYYISEEELKDNLDQVNIEINTIIPEDTPDLGLLEVKYEDYTNDQKKIKLAKEMLGVGDVIQMSDIEADEGIVRFNKNNKSLTIIEEKEIIYHNKTRNENFDVDYDANQLNKIVDDFLERCGFSTDDYAIVDIRQNEDSYYLEYSPIYEDTFVERSYMRFTIEMGTVVKFQRLWLEPIKEKDNNIKLRPATESLLKLLADKEVWNKNIKNIVLCYYFDPEDTSISGFGALRSGDAIPAWKVEFTDGTIKYLYQN